MRHDPTSGELFGQKKARINGLDISIWLRFALTE